MQCSRVILDKRYHAVRGQLKEVDKDRPFFAHHSHENSSAVGSLVVRAPESGPESLGSMHVPPNTLRVHSEYVLVKSVGPKVL
ncbi:hypothetical protein TNCV_4061981 [Trichonephila clavipes]|nr:hypothetical protein TNCV_4061981 [Trichonephila clavipes]